MILTSLPSIKPVPSSVSFAVTSAIAVPPLYPSTELLLSLFATIGKAAGGAAIGVVALSSTTPGTSVVLTDALFTRSAPESRSVCFTV